MGRRGFTLIELVVAMAIGLVLIVLAYNAILLMTTGEKLTDKEASRAIVESRLMQALLMDLRSATDMTTSDSAAETRYVIKRWNLKKDKSLEPKQVTWVVVKDPKKPVVTRQMEGEKLETFGFSGLLEPNTPAFELKVERLKDTNVVFPP